MPGDKEENWIPADVLAAGLDIFTTTEALAGWLRKPAKWAAGETPEALIRKGRTDDVVGALKGLAYGNFL